MGHQQQQKKNVKVHLYMGYMGLYIGFVRPSRVWLSAVLVINRVSILAILIINRVWFLHSLVNGTMFILEEATLLSFLVVPINKALHNSISYGLN